LRKLATFAVALVAVVAWFGLGWSLRSSQATPISRNSTPQRIVSLTPDTTEILFALGLGDKVVGVSTSCDWPPEALTRPKVGTYWVSDVEAIMMLKPDLVVGESSSKLDVLRRLAGFGYQTAAIRMDKLADLLQAIDGISDMTGAVSAGRALKAAFDGRLQHVQAVVSGRPRTRVLWVIQAEPLRVAGHGTFVNEIIELAGGENAIGPTSMQYPPVGIEHVVGANVDVIIEPAMGTSASIALQQEQARARWSRWPAIPAVANGRIYVIPPDTVSRLSPRFPEGVEMVARLLHPDCFAENVKDTGK
jgi:iron complex transport system substrate-binding protein